MARAVVTLGIVLLIAAGMLVACSTTRPLPPDNGTAQRPVITDNGNVGRPDIPRVNPPQDTPDNTIYRNTTDGQQSGRSPLLIVNETPSVDLDLPMGEPLGAQYPIIAATMFPLLHHPPIRVTGDLLVGYEETLRFDFGDNSTGTIEFAKDPNDESIGTFLRFEHDKPIFEYRVTLDQGTFEDLQGRDIQILGETYTIAQANNFSVSLYGKTVANNLYFTDGQRLTANSSYRMHTVANVTPDSISYVLYANGDDGDHDILLAPGESLASKAGQLSLASDIFDLRYRGAPMQNASVFTFTRTGYGYNLDIDTFKGKVSLPIVQQDAGQLILGGVGSVLRLTPCPSALPYCVTPDDLLPLTSPDGRTFFVRYDGAHQDPNEIIFSDTNNNKYHYKYAGTPGSDASVDIGLEDTAFHVDVGPFDNASGTYNISIDQGYDNGRVDLVDSNGVILRVGDIAGNSTLPIEAVVPSYRRNGVEEDIPLNLTLDGSGAWHATVGNITFVQDPTTDDTFGATPYGTAVMLQRTNADEGLAYNTGDNAVILVPDSTAYGMVTLEG